MKDSRGTWIGTVGLLGLLAGAGPSAAQSPPWIATGAGTGAAAE